MSLEKNIADTATANRKNVIAAGNIHKNKLEKKLSINSTSSNYYDGNHENNEDKK